MASHIYYTKDLPLRQPKNFLNRAARSIKKTAPPIFSDFDLTPRVYSGIINLCLNVKYVIALLSGTLDEINTTCTAQISARFGGTILN